jgi:hypothetical protein
VAQDTNNQCMQNGKMFHGSKLRVERKEGSRSATPRGPSFSAHTPTPRRTGLPSSGGIISPDAVKGPTPGSSGLRARAHNNRMIQATQTPIHGAMANTPSPFGSHVASQSTMPLGMNPPPFPYAPGYPVTPQGTPGMYPGYPGYYYSTPMQMQNAFGIQYPPTLPMAPQPMPRPTLPAPDRHEDADRGANTN